MADAARARTLDSTDGPSSSARAREAAAEEREIEALFERLADGARIPRATYRIQLNGGLGFARAAELVAYLDALGVSDLYASPFFRARPGSLHGYDLVDHNQLNPELGTEAELERLGAELRARRMGLLLDFVPNHMGVGGSENGWWMDVLENGPASLYAAYFDIDWRPRKAELEGKVLLPILGDHYGRALEDGGLVPGHEAGAFFVRYHATRLPLDPRTYAAVLGPVRAELARELGDEHEAVLELDSILIGLRNLPEGADGPRSRRLERRREKEIQKRRLSALVEAEPAVAAAIDRRIGALAGRVGEPRSFDELDALLERQAYRLCNFRAAAEEINYRRFFDVNELAAIRMENPAVFADAHRLLFRLLGRGLVTGLRIDHIDGLWDPHAYLGRVQRVVFQDAVRGAAGGSERRAEALLRRYDERLATRPEAPPRPLFIVAEKILSRGEELPRSFAVHGTSGYDFAALAGGLFVDPAGERALTETYERFIGQRLDLATLVYEKKKLVLEGSMASELAVLAHALNRLSERDRHTRDFTLGTLTDALREVIACFPVYRTYVGEGSVAAAPRDRAAINVAVRLARRRRPTIDRSVFEFLRAILTLDHALHDGSSDEVRLLVMRFQELTGPVMAKGVEDTAFYVYNRLASLNEVGGEPSQLGVGLAELHQASAERQRRSPGSLSTTSTHDTKRSEDVRARISVLSELPGEWAATLERAAAAAAPFRTPADGAGGALGTRGAPDPNEEYLFYQTVLGTWPDGEVLGEGYALRLVAYLRKATKEAKVNTSWVDGAPEYDAAVERFVRGALGSAAFAAALAPLARTLAFHGRFGSLSQVLLKLTSPGVPDLYQGTELWDDSLVDPDNRRPVDFDIRRAMLAAQLDRERREGRLTLARELLADAATGGIKLHVIRIALDARRRHPAAFGEAAEYLPVLASGPFHDHVVAFRRRGGAAELVTIVPRFTARLAAGRRAPPLGPIWGATALPLPAGRYRELFTGREIHSDGGPLPMAELLRDFPLALLEKCATIAGRT